MGKSSDRWRPPFLRDNFFYVVTVYTRRPDMELSRIDKVFHTYHSVLVKQKEAVRGISRKRNGQQSWYK